MNGIIGNDNSDVDNDDQYPIPLLSMWSTVLVRAYNFFHRINRLSTE
jgi:hypothetical protein